jgi:hypothetical protein
MAFSGHSRGAATGAKVGAHARKETAMSLEDFTQFGQATLAHLLLEAEEVERACSRFETLRGMPPGSANLGVVKALMRGGEARAGGGLCDEMQQDLRGTVQWSDSEDGHKRRVEEAFGLRCVENSADGNCFFESLQQVLRDIGHADAGDSVRRIRRKLVDALAGARDVYIDFISSDEDDLASNRFDLDEEKFRTHAGKLTEWARYIAHLRGNRVWANNLLVAAVPAVYGVVLKCFLRTEKSQTLNTYSPVGGRDWPVVYLYCDNRHYEAMVGAAVPEAGGARNKNREKTWGAKNATRTQSLIATLLTLLETADASERPELLDALDGLM